MRIICTILIVFPNEEMKMIQTGGAYAGKGRRRGRGRVKRGRKPMRRKGVEVPRSAACLYTEGFSLLLHPLHSLLSLLHFLGLGMELVHTMHMLYD